MIRNLNHSLKKIFKKERLISERVSSLHHQQLLLEAERAAIASQRQHHEVVDLIDNQIEDENLDSAMVEFNQFKARMEPTTVVVQNVSTPRVKKPRPVNWRDITWDYMSYNDIHRTIRRYNLKDHNEKLSYWYSILP